MSDSGEKCLFLAEAPLNQEQKRRFEQVERKETFEQKETLEQKEASNQA